MDKLEFHIQNNKKYVCSLYAFLGFISIFVSFEGLFSDSMKIFLKIIISLLMFVGVWIFIFACVCIYCFRKKRVEVFKGNSGNKLFVHYGDLFDKSEVLHINERRNIVIPVNKCFDTIVDN